MSSAVREFAGTLRYQVTLESPGETVSAGDATPTWTVVSTVWASMDGLTGVNRGGITADAEYRFTMRYRSDVLPSWRLGLNSRKFGIISVVDPTGDRERLVILAAEILPV